MENLAEFPAGFVDDRRGLPKDELGQVRSFVVERDMSHLQSIDGPLLIQIEIGDQERSRIDLAGVVVEHEVHGLDGIFDDVPERNVVFLGVGRGR